MNYADADIPDFSSVLSQGGQSIDDTLNNNMEQNDPAERDLEEESLDESSEDEEVSDDDSGSDSDASEVDPMHESASESDDDEPQSDDDESQSDDDDSVSEEYESDSEYDSDGAQSTGSYESLQASKTIRFGAGDESNGGGFAHVYEDDGQHQDDVEDEDGEEVNYEDTDLGGEDVATASLIAASLVAGGGAVRSGNGWTWMSMFIVLSAAGGLGLVLLYAIKRINDLTRLVKSLEENSHMAINERDVQVITTQVIGDMLQDSEEPDGTDTESSRVGKEDTVQAEFDNFAVDYKKETIENAQTISDLLQDEDPSDDEKVEITAEQKMDVCTTDGIEGLGGETLVHVANETSVDESVVQDVTEKEEKKVREIVPEKAVITAEEIEEKVDDDTSAITEERHQAETSSNDVVSKDEPKPSPANVVEEDNSEPSAAQVAQKEPKPSSIDDLATMIETMSLSDDRVMTRESSRLITAARRS
jgi:hypothetical protein